MHALPRPARSPHRRMLWLIWFSLLLPLAQLSAALHAYGHLARTQAAAQQAGVGEPADGVHGGPCELCLQAANASLLAGPTANTLAPRLAEAHGSWLSPAAAHPGAAPTHRPYAARAPPTLLS